MAASSLAVWVTRAQPGADQTAARLLALGRHPLVAPVLDVRPVPRLSLDLRGVGALAFTSANGVRAFAALSPRRELVVFAVGEATAAAAKAAGFDRIQAQSGDVAALAAHIVMARDRFAGALLHPCAQAPAGDLVGDLVRAGLAARAVAVYETAQCEVLPDCVAAALDQRGLGAVLVHSPRAARIIARLIGTPQRRAQAQGLSVFGLSPACLAPLAPLAFARTAAAARPAEDDLLAELARS